MSRRFLTAPIIEGILLVAVTPWLLFPSEVPIVTLAALVTAALIWLRPLLMGRAAFPTTSFNLALLIFEMSVLVGILVTGDPELTLPKATGIILGLTTLRYIVYWIRDYTRLSYAAAAFLLLGLGFIAFGILGGNWTLKIPFLEPILRMLPSGLVVPPEAPALGISTNQLAGILLAYLPLTLSLVIDQHRARRQKWKIVLLSITSFALAAWLIFTQSRAGWIGGMAGIATVLLMWLLLIRTSQHFSKYPTKILNP